MVTFWEKLRDRTRVMQMRLYSSKGKTGRK